MTPEERKEYLDKIFQDYQSGKITLEESRRLRAQVPPVFIAPPPTPVETPLPYRPASDVDKATSQAIDAVALRYSVEQGLSQEEAYRKAREEVEAQIKPTTQQYTPEPAIGLSRIVDVEKGLVRDAQTGEIRPGTSAELIGQSFLRQRLGTQEDIEAGLKVQREQARRESFERQKRQELARIEREKAGVSPLEEMGFQALEFAESFGLGTVPETAKETAAEYLMSPSTQTGDVYESTLGASLRGAAAVFGAPPVLAAAYERTVPGMKESEMYRMADSGDFLDQVAVNIANIQGLPEAFATNEVLSDIGGENVAWWTGLGIEAFSPIGPGLVLRPVVKGISSASKTKATQKMVDQMFEDVGMQGVSSKNVVERYSDSIPDFQKNAKRNNLVSTSSEAVAEHLAVLHTVRAGLDASPDGIKIADFDALGATPTGQAIILQSKSPDTLTKANSGKFVTEQLDKFKNAAKTNPDVARIYNEGVSAQRRVTEGLKRSTAPNRVATTTLTTDFESELVKNKIGRLLAEGQITKKSLVRLLNVAKETDGKLSKNDITRINEFIKKTDGTESLDDVYSALRTTLRTPIKERLLNFLPTDLSLIAGDTVINTSAKGNRFFNSKNYKKFINEQKNYNKNISFDAKTNTYKVNASIQEDLVKDIIDYFGPDRIRQSEGLRELLSDVLEGTIKVGNRDLVGNAYKAQGAVRHLGGFKLREAGEQYRRAALAPEFRGDVVAVSEAQELSKQLGKGFIGQVVRDFKNVKKAFSQPAEILEGIQPSIGFAELSKQLNGAQDKVVEETTKELARLTKKYGGDGVRALDELGSESYNMAVKSVDDYTDKTAQNAFDGSYIDYIETFVEERFKEDLLRRIKRKISKEQNLPKGLAAFMGKDELFKLYTGKGTKGNEVAREVLLDHQRYFTKLDAWKSMVTRYYGATKVNALFKDDSGFRTILLPNGAQLQPLASNILDISFSNFVTVTKRMKNQYPSLDPLKTMVTGKPVPTIPYAEWLVGTRSGNILSDLQAKWIDQNPRYRLQYYPDYTSFASQTDLSPLVKSYENMIVKNLNTASNDVIKQGARQLAEAQYEAVKKVSEAQRETIINKLVVLMRDKKTLYPDIRTMQGSFKQELAIPKQIMDAQVNKFLREIFREAKPDNLAKISESMKNDVWNLMLDPPPPDGRFYGGASMSVLMDLSDSVRQFYRANGLAVGNDIVATMDSNLPLFQRIQNTPYAQMYGTNMASDVNRMYDMAKSGKLREMMNSLRKSDAETTEIIGGTLLNLVSWTRRSMTQGLLGGFPLPGTRYLGINIFSAPFIMMGTLGLSRTFSAFSPKRLSSALRQAMSITQIPDDVVVFTTKQGRKYTAKELRLLESQNNLGLTTGRVQFYENHAGEMMTAANLNVAGQKIGFPTKLISQLNPGQRNLWSHIADATDMTYRRSAFYSALADDMPIDQAVDIAKRSLLDYGAMSKMERQAMERGLMFWSFARQIHSEFLNAMAKALLGGTSHKFVISAMRASMKQQNRAGSWYNGDDSVYSRVYSFWAGKQDNRPSYTYGFDNPYAQAFDTYVTFASLVAAPENIDDAIVKALTTGRVRPGLDQIRKVLTNKYGKRVPSDVIYLAKSLDIWPWFQEQFKVKSVRSGERLRLGEPTFDGYQYEFADEAKMKEFSAWLFAFTLLGVQRNIRDYTKTAMAFDTQPEGMDLKRMQDPNPLLYLFGLETSLQTKDIMDASFQNQKRIETELKQIIKQNKY